jgi:hypothetical protein
MNETGYRIGEVWKWRRGCLHAQPRTGSQDLALICRLFMSASVMLTLCYLPSPTGRVEGPESFSRDDPRAGSSLENDLGEGQRTVNDAVRVASELVPA